MTVVIGTAGHIDHGKTTLLRALTGIDADRLPEERRRGMTIDVGYAHLRLTDGTELDFVDVPGHDRLVGNMLVGAGEIDAAMLVVAADDGPRAQTIEHLALLDALGIRHGIAVVTKADVAGPARTAEVVADVARLLAGTSLLGSPIVAVSSVDGGGIEGLRDALAALRDATVRAVATPRTADASSPSGAPGARLAIDRVFAVKGRGVVVTGTLRGHGFGHDATLRLVPGDGTVRVREIQVHGVSVDRAERGRTALNIAGVDPGEVHRGMVLTDDPWVVASDRILVVLRTTIPDRARVRLHAGTAAVEASIGRSGRDALDLPDGAALATLRLAGLIAVAAGDRVVLRRSAGADRVVGATMLDVAPPRGISRRRQSVERVARLVTAVGTGDRAATEAARLGLHGVLEPVTGSLAIAPDVRRDVGMAVIEAIDGVMSLTAARTVADRALRRRVTLGRDTAASAAVGLVDELIRDGRLTRDGLDVRRPGTAPAIHEPHPTMAAAMDRLERALAVAAPPALGDAARATACPPDGVRALDRAGRIHILEPDLAYASSTYRALEAQALAMSSQAPLTPAAFRDATGTSRKYVMAILADLDRRGILRRTDAGHLPGPRAAGVER